MKTIIVDDEPIMLSSFMRYAAGIEALNITGQFEDPEEALAFAKSHEIELAILDIAMPGMSGLELAKALRALYPELLIVFITAYDEHLQASNELNADYYILKPYKRETIMQMAKRMTLLSGRLKKALRVQMFGRFVLYHHGHPVPLSGKAKEILALAATRRGKEISNEELYSTIWEEREYSNVHMKVYYNALKRLKDTLAKEGISDLLISTPRGQIFNAAIVDCDYYAWQDNNPDQDTRFEGEFLPEYFWGESILAGILTEMDYL